MSTDSGLHPDNDPRYMTNFPPCFYCIHLTEIGTQTSLEGWKCTAFPDGILYPILKWYWPHNEVYPGQPVPDVFESEVQEINGKKFKMTVEGKWYEVEA